MAHNGIRSGDLIAGQETGHSAGLLFPRPRA